MASKVTFATLALYVSQLSSEDRNTLCTFLFSFVGKNYTSYNMIELIEVVKELESTLDEEAKKSVLDLYIEKSLSLSPNKKIRLENDNENNSQTDKVNELEKENDNENNNENDNEKEKEKANESKSDLDSENESEDEHENQNQNQNQKENEKEKGKGKVIERGCEKELLEKLKHYNLPDFVTSNNKPIVKGVNDISRWAFRIQTYPSTYLLANTLANRLGDLYKGDTRVLNEKISACLTKLRQPKKGSIVANSIPCSGDNKKLEDMLKEQGRSEKDLSKLITATFKSRGDYFQKTVLKTSLETHPWIKKSKYLWLEFGLMTQHGKELNFLETEIKELIGKVQTDLTSKFETDIEQIKKNFEKDIKEQNKITIEILEVLAKKVTSGRAKTNTKSIIHFYKDQNDFYPTTSTSPMLAIQNQNFCIVIEKFVIINNIRSVAEGLSLLLGCFYVFDMQFPTEGNNLLKLLEFLLGIVEMNSLPNTFQLLLMDSTTSISTSISTSNSTSTSTSSSRSSSSSAPPKKKSQRNRKK